jgi:uncharacterized SAM-binding protein YcdF (DUF218 family)
MNFIQEQITFNNFFLLGVLFLGVLTYYKGLRKSSWYWGVFIVIGIVSTTNALPSYLVKHYESEVTVCNPKLLDTNKIYYIHVLGAGYSLDHRLPAIAQLNQFTLSRLVEGIRIARQLPNYVIVTSANSQLGLEPQASVAKRAAIELGIPSQNIEMLTTPSNTAEEVAAFIKKFGIYKNVIVVSDAMHLPRALMLYKKAGITAIPAPSNFKVKQGPHEYNGLTFPTLSSLNLMNQFLREQLKYLKDSREWGVFSKE